jgi:hypothetical protein
MDLRTEVVTASVRQASTPRNRRTRIAVAVTVMVLLVGAPAWVLLPVEPIPVAVTPLVNGTGLPDLDGYEFALAEELAARLRTSRAVRVLPPQRVREILTAYRAGDADFKDRTAAQSRMAVTRAVKKLTDRLKTPPST